MYNCVKFGVADHKKCKEIIKIWTVKHLQKEMKEKYGIYMIKSIVQNYMQPRHLKMRKAQRHHHSVQISLASVRRNEMANHIDKYYCLTFIKGIKLFISAFSNEIVLISQDDKAKVFIYNLFFNISF